MLEVVRRNGEKMRELARAARHLRLQGQQLMERLATVARRERRTAFTTRGGGSVRCHDCSKESRRPSRDSRRPPEYDIQTRESDPAPLEPAPDGPHSSDA